MLFTGRMSSVESTLGTTRMNPDMSIMSGANMKPEDQFQFSLMTDEHSIKKPLSPFKQMPKKELVVPNPNDKVVHQKLYEFLRAEKERRSNDQHEMAAEEQRMKEFVDK